MVKDSISQSEKKIVPNSFSTASVLSVECFTSAITSFTLLFSSHLYKINCTTSPTIENYVYTLDPINRKIYLLVRGFSFQMPNMQSSQYAFCFDEVLIEWTIYFPTASKHQLQHNLHKLLKYFSILRLSLFYT